MSIYWGNIFINPTILPFVITYCLYNFEFNVSRKYAKKIYLRFSKNYLIVNYVIWNYGKR